MWQDCCSKEKGTLSAHQRTAVFRVERPLVATTLYAYHHLSSLYYFNTHPLNIGTGHTVSRWLPKRTVCVFYSHFSVFILDSIKRSLCEVSPEPLWNSEVAPADTMLAVPDSSYIPAGLKMETEVENNLYGYSASPVSVYEAKDANILLVVVTCSPH